ncbi:MAG: molecular chaperone TorD family protein [Nitrospirae bacterium]|nr:molecular chaperone TorD family protein [Nitrospirota bacterium]
MTTSTQEVEAVPDVSVPPPEPGSPPATRSRVYKLLALGLEFPDPDFFEEIQQGGYERALGDALAALPFVLPAEALPAAGALRTDAALDYQAFESEFIRLFEVGSGGGGPPCPLYAGEYGGGRLKTMEEALRFYDFFGLRLSDAEGRELPDHATVQLEFLHFLAYREGAPAADGPDPVSLQRAEADFLERQAARWLPLLAKRVASQETLPFFKSLVRLAADFARADLHYVKSLLATGGVK